MIDFPISTFLNKRIPKQRFYDNLSVTPELKKAFSEQIAAIYWRNKLAPSTLNLALGQNVIELQVFELHLNQSEIDWRVLQLMDREIPYHILFLLRHEQMVQAWIGYKEASLTKAATFVVERYYQTDWHALEELPLSLQGLSMDTVYENLLRQIAGDRLNISPNQDTTQKISLKQTVERAAKREKLLRQIAALEKKVRDEKQFNVQVALNTKLKHFQKMLEELNG